MESHKEIFKKNLSALKNKEFVWVIHYEGVPLKLKSGKSSWNSIGAAKSALRNEFHYLIYNISVEKGFKVGVRGELANELYSLVEFKKL